MRESMGEEVKNDDEEQPAMKKIKQQPDSADDDLINEKTDDRDSVAVEEEEDDDLVVTSLFDIDSQDDDDDDDEYGATTEDDDQETPVVVDRKGKGIMLEKQSIIHSSDDLSDHSDSLDVLSDDDPLAEVDLDNILPSRTRTRTSSVTSTALRISNNLHHPHKNNN